MKKWGSGSLPPEALFFYFFPRLSPPELCLTGPQVLAAFFLCFFLTSGAA